MRQRIYLLVLTVLAFLFPFGNEWLFGYWYPEYGANYGFALGAGIGFVLLVRVLVLLRRHA